jgi:hypothetical protein
LRGKPAALTVKATRAPGFTDEISLSGVALPPNVEANLKSIPKNQNEIAAELKPGVASSVGKFLISITGKAKYQDKEYVVMAPPAELVLSPPFELNVDPTAICVTVGEKVKLKVTAVRKPDYDGPIELALANLPQGVTSDKATLGKDKTEIHIELTAKPGAAVKEHVGITVVGTAVGTDNQTHASTELTITIRPNWRKLRLPVVG